MKTFVIPACFSLTEKEINALKEIKSGEYDISVGISDKLEKLNLIKWFNKGFRVYWKITESGRKILWAAENNGLDLIELKSEKYPTFNIK